MTQAEPEGGKIIAAHARALVDYLRGRGVDPAQLVDADLLKAIESDDARTPIPLRRWQAMFDEAIVATGDPHLPLKVGESYKPRHYGMLGYLAMACGTLHDVIAMMGRYERLTDDINDSKLVVGRKYAEVHWLPASAKASPTMSQLSLSGWICFARLLTDRPDLRADACFGFPRPRDITEYARIFGGTVRFDQPITRLVMPAEYLELRIAHSDPHTHRVLREQAEAMLGQRGRDEPDFVRELKTVLSLKLASGRCTLAHAAQDLKLAPRTLQRRLDQASLSFREVLDDVRRSHAERHLRDPRVSLAEVAFLLGYSEQSPFQHAFRRWSGESPGAYRRRVVADVDAVTAGRR